MSTEGREEEQILILGVGNTLLCDDGFGVHVTERLRRDYALGDGVAICDGGTIGLALLPDIENSDRLIVIDAGELKDAPGTMRVYFNDDMDRHLSTCKGTVHEVAMSDLLQAARLTGKAPRERALIVVQPETTGWGEAPTENVAAAIPKACETVLDLIGRWRQ